MWLATFAAIAAFLPYPSRAEETSAANAPAATHPDGTNDILVVAQRRPARENDVPAAIDVVRANDLIGSTTRRFDDIARLDTSVQLSAYQGEMQLFVRGIGAVTFIGGYDSSVAVFSDDVYLSRPSAAAPAFFDLDRVEVLKGPQGSLYGRNATGGAILLVNKKPTMDWQGETRLTLGNYDGVDAFAAVGGPLANDVAFRLAVGTNNHSGYTRLNFGPSYPGGGSRHADGEDQHDLTSRLSLSWQPAGPVSVELTGDYYRANDRAVIFQFAGPGYANSPLFLARLAEGQLGPYRSRTINTSVLPYDRPKNYGLSGKISIDLPFGTLASLSAFRRTRPENFDDTSNSTVLGESQYKEEHSSQLTQDITLTSDQKSRISYVAGFSYFHEHDRIRNEYFFPYLETYLGGTGTPSCCLLKANGHVRTDAIAFYGEAETPITGRLSTIMGARYSREWKAGDNLSEFTGLQTLNNSSFVPAAFSAFTPKMGFQYRLDPNTQIYATISKGYKSGGYNIGTSDNQPFRPEKIWSYEVGAKLQIPSIGLSGAISAFHYDYTDLQVQDVADNTVVIRNAATAKVDGIELGLRLQPLARFTIDVAGTWLHARFAQFHTINLKTPELGTLDLSGNPLPQSPKWKGRVSADYELPLSASSRLDFRFDALWQDRIYFSTFRDPKAMQRQYAWLKGRIALRQGRSELSAYIDNIANVRVFTNISITGDLDGSRANGNMAPPRTFGASFARTF